MCRRGGPFALGNQLPGLAPGAIAEPTERVTDRQDIRSDSAANMKCDRCTAELNPEWRYCSRCGVPLPLVPWSTWLQDASRRRCVGRAIPGSRFVTVKHISSDRPLVMAGRYLVLVREGSLELIDIDDLHGGYNDLMHEDFLYYRAAARLSCRASLESTPAVFLPPHLYVVADGGISRLHVGRGEEEVICADRHALPSGSPAAARDRGRGYTAILFPLGARFCLVVTDRSNVVQSQTMQDLPVKHGHWRSPVWRSGVWVLIDTAGKLCVIRGVPEPPFWSVDGRFPESVLGDAGLADVTVSPPCAIRNSVFVAYRSSQENGICRLNLSNQQVSRMRSPKPLAGSFEFPPLPFSEPPGQPGVLWPVRGEPTAFFAPVTAETGAEFSIEGVPGLTHEQAVQFTDGWVVWMAGAGGTSESQLVQVRVDAEHKRLLASPVADVPMSANDALGLFYLAAGISSQPCFVLQGKSTLGIGYVSDDGEGVSP